MLLQTNDISPDFLKQMKRFETATAHIPETSWFVTQYEIMPWIYYITKHYINLDKCDDAYIKNIIDILESNNLSKNVKDGFMINLLVELDNRKSSKALKNHLFPWT